MSENEHPGVVYLRHQIKLTENSAASAARLLDDAEFNARITALNNHIAALQSSIVELQKARESAGAKLQLANVELTRLNRLLELAVANTTFAQAVLVKVHLDREAARNASN